MVLTAALSDAAQYELEKETTLAHTLDLEDKDCTILRAEIDYEAYYIDDKKCFIQQLSTYRD